MSRNLPLSKTTCAEMGVTYYERGKDGAALTAGGDFGGLMFRLRTCGRNHLLSSSKTLFLKPNFFTSCVIMSSFLLFIYWRKVKEREEDEEVVTRLSLLGSMTSVSH